MSEEKKEKKEEGEEKDEEVTEIPKEGAEEKDLEDIKKTEKGEEKKVEVKEFDKGSWNPKTSLGLKVKNGEILDLNDILDNGLNILEAEIVDVLLPGLENDLLLIGQSKGKFGGGQRRVFKQTQKKTKEGNKPKFATCAVVGNRNGFVGVGYGKAKETVPAREKSFRRAKLNIMKIRRGCGSWMCNCKEPHSIPFAVEGRCSSVNIILMPAPKGKGLCAENEVQKILSLAGIKDVWSKTQGQTKSKLNLIEACVRALKKLMEIKIKPEDVKKLGIVEGRVGEK